MDAHTDGQRENSIPTTNKVTELGGGGGGGGGGIKMCIELQDWHIYFSFQNA